MNRSPGTRRKAKAPPPPPSASALPCQQNEEIISSEENYTGNQRIDDQDKIGRKMFTSKSVEESSSQSNQLKNIYKRLTKGFSFVSARFVVQIIPLIFAFVRWCECPSFKLHY